MSTWSKLVRLARFELTLIKSEIIDAAITLSRLFFVILDIFLSFKILKRSNLKYLETVVKELDTDDVLPRMAKLAHIRTILLLDAYNDLKNVTYLLNS